MKSILYVLIALFAITSTTGALAAKPEGKGKPEKSMEMRDKVKQQDDDEIEDALKEKKEKAKKIKEQKSKEAKEKHKEHDDRDDLDDEGKPAWKENGEKSPGLAKQHDKKTEQEMKEAGKGSETGQAKREEKSKKWWKFWE